MEYLLIFLGVIFIAGFIALFFNIKKISSKGDDEKMIVLNERMENLTQNIKSLNEEVSSRMKEQRESVEKSTLNVYNQVRGFTSGITSLAEKVNQVQDSVKNVSSFQEMFRAPKLRGIWGEMSLDASLSQYFSRDSYKTQHYFKSGEAVDAILKLPNELILPIDSKFNWENFEKMINSEKEDQRLVFQKTFFNDVKKKIDEISSKYILPSEGTVDMALMYVPAETVYYELISNTKMVDVPNYARKKKIVLTSPNTFMSHVSAIQHWVKDIQLSKQTKEIMKKLDRVITDSVKLEEDFGKLGKHMKDAQSAFDNSEKRLGLMTDRVQKVMEIENEEEEVKKLDTDHQEV